MEIQFRCNNVSRHDQSTGRHEQCGQLLQANENHAGLKVRCPKCQQMMVVPVQDEERETEKSSRFEVGDTPVQRKTNTVGTVAPGYQQFNRRVRCRKCGASLDDQGRCTACYYVAPQLRAIDTPIDQIPIQPAGFQLWLQGILSDGIGARMLATAAHSLVAIAVMLSLLASLALGGSAAAIVGAGLAVFVAIYVYVVFQTIRLARVPAARLPLFLRPIWYFLLVAARMGKWESYDSRLKDRIVVDVRGQAFGDRDLLELDKLPVCQVLDAQGTDLTDAGLALMHGLKNLRCLVVRRTHVTREGVFRLQQAIPKCWIWY